MAFLGEVKDKRLKAVSNVSNPLIIHAVKEILGDDFIMTEYRYRVNTDITGGFLATIITAGEAKETAELLCRKLFNASYLWEIDTVIANIDENFTIPYPEDYFADHEVHRRPILSYVNVDVFESRKPEIHRHLRFVQKFLGLKLNEGEGEGKGEDWIKAYIREEGLHIENEGEGFGVDIGEED